MDNDYQKKYKSYLKQFYKQNGGASPPPYQEMERPIPAARPVPAPRPRRVQRDPMVPSHSQLNPPNHGIHFLRGQEEELERLNLTPPTYGEDVSLYGLLTSVIDDFLGISDYKILYLKKQLNLSRNDSLRLLSDTVLEPGINDHLQREMERFNAKVILSFHRRKTPGVSTKFSIHIIYPNDVKVTWYPLERSDGNLIYINSEQYIMELREQSHQFHLKQLQENDRLKRRISELEQILSRRDQTQSRREPVMRCIAAPVNQAKFTNDNNSIGSQYLDNSKDLKSVDSIELKNIMSQLNGDLNSSPVEYGDKPILNQEERLNLIKILDQEYNKNNSNDIIINLSKDKILESISQESFENIKNIFNNNIDTIKLRRVVADDKIIKFHTDYSQKTMQIALNNDSDYVGGKITFIGNNGKIFQPQRDAGFYTIHNSGIVHGVSKLEKGVRYGLFLCDTHNNKLEYLIQPVLNQFKFFQEAVKFLKEKTNDQLIEYENKYKILFNNDFFQKDLNIFFNDLGLKIFHKTHMLHPKEYNDKTINFDMVSAVRRQELFMNDILKVESEYNNQKAISKAIQDYNQFLELFKYGTKENLAPLPIVDLVWHTHQQFPEKYKIECQSICGSFLDHDDSVDKIIIQKAGIEREKLESHNLIMSH